MEEKSLPASEGFPAGEVLGLDAFARHVFFLVRAVLFLQPLRHFGDVFTGANVCVSGFSPVQINFVPLTVRAWAQLTNFNCVKLEKMAEGVKTRGDPDDRPRQDYCTITKSGWASESPPRRLS